jgi:hypothetical protein
MGNIHQEIEHLTLADQHLDAGERRTTNPSIHIKEMTTRGQDTTTGDQTLRLFQNAGLTVAGRVNPT